MKQPDPTLESLRKAVAQSPDNLPLRQLLADQLYEKKEFADAEKEYRVALALDAENVAIKLGLARTFYQLSKHDAALVLVEDLVARGQLKTEGRMLLVRLRLHEGRIAEALRDYRQIVAVDPDLADKELEERYGLHADNGESDVVDGRLREAAGEIPVFVDSLLERPHVSFEDVGGMDEVKEEVQMKILHPLQHPELYKAYGKSVGGGILMYGPPGCGKTFLARATAGEVDAGFISVGIHDVLDMWIGQSERNLHDLFEQARINTPCVLFFDEVDALGAKRSDMRQSAGKQIINQFLSELDGVQSSNEGVLILAATNAPWHLDSAFRRPGRFDRVLFVPPPDEPARASILGVLLKGKPVGDVDLPHLAKKTEGFSGADLKAVVDIAIEVKLREAMKKGKTVELSTKDFVKSLAKVKPSTREWFSTARNYALYSNQGGIYDDILAYLKIQK